MEQENLLTVLAAQRLPNAEKLKDLRAAFLSEKDPQQREVIVCYGTGCLAAGAAKVEQAFKKASGQERPEYKGKTLDSRPPAAGGFAPGGLWW